MSEQTHMGDWRRTLRRLGRRWAGPELLGWSVSLAVHLVAFTLLWSVTWSIRQADSSQRVIVPEARLARSPGEPIRSVEPLPRLAASEDHVREPRYTPSRQEMELPWQRPQQVESALKIIGIGTGGGVPLAGASAVSSAAEAGPRSGFFGSGGNAYRICYVIDRSGSMLESFDYVRRELKESIRQLAPQQEFHVIFFSAGPPVESPPKKLVHATPEAKAQAFAFLDGIVAAGQTDPTDALQRAFSLVPRPELIYFMTDGEFDPSVLEKLREWNAKRAVHINTIAFLYELGAPLLKQIAQEHGGHYRFVSEEDLR